MAETSLDLFNRVMCALTGKSFLYEKYNLSVYQLQPKFDPDLEAIRTLIGGKDDKWAVSLYRIAMSEPIVGCVLPVNPESTDLSGLLPEEENEDGLGTLISTPDGLAAIVPSNVDTVTWPYPSHIFVKYYSDSSVQLTIGTNVIYAPASVDGTRLRIAWPPELAIRGDIQLEDATSYAEGWTTKIPVLLTYPTDLVAELVYKNPTCISAMEKCDLLGDFFLADNSRERLAILVLTLYKLTTYGF